MSSFSGLSLKSRRILFFNQAPSSRFSLLRKLPEFASLEIQRTEDIEFGRGFTENDEERGAGDLLYKGRGSPSTILLGG